MDLTTTVCVRAVKDHGIELVTPQKVFKIKPADSGDSGARDFMALYDALCRIVSASNCALARMFGDTELAGEVRLVDVDSIGEDAKAILHLLEREQDEPGVLSLAERRRAREIRGELRRLVGKGGNVGVERMIKRGGEDKKTSRREQDSGKVQPGASGARQEVQGSDTDVADLRGDVGSLAHDLAGQGGMRDRGQAADGWKGLIKSKDGEGEEEAVDSVAPKTEAHLEKMQTESTLLAGEFLKQSDGLGIKGASFVSIRKRLW